jgi:peroxiredoxin-like protein
MEAKKAFKVFHYQSQARWTSGRSGLVSSAGKPDLEVSSPPEFKGEAGKWTPEDMFVASVNLCVLLTFAAYAQNKGLDLVSYESPAEGTLEMVEGKYRFTQVVLRPQIAVRAQESLERARQILENAHRDCLVTNSVTATVQVVPDIRVAG